MNRFLDPEHVLKLYEKVSDSEQHFNNLQLEYRKLASVWLLAVFGGIGFVLTKDMENMQDDFRLLLIAGIGLSGFLGICLIWLLDLIVYHRLLRSYFLTGLRMERMFSDLLPPTRSIMKLLDSNRWQILTSVFLYYFIPSLVCVGIFCGGLWLISKECLVIGRFEMVISHWMIGTLIIMAGIAAYLIRFTLIREEIGVRIKNLAFNEDAIAPMANAKSTSWLKVVLTGGPGSGKTTLLEQLRAAGFPVVEESAVLAMETLAIMLGGEKQQVGWRSENSENALRFQQMIINLSQAQERMIDSMNRVLFGPGKQIIFLDRGVHDSLAYFKKLGIKEPEGLLKVCQETHYDAIMVLDTPDNFSPRPDRTTRTREESEEMKKLHEIVYNEYFPERVFSLRVSGDRYRDMFELLRKASIFKSKGLG